MEKHSERGAILVHVALSIVALIGFSAFTIDYGQYFVSRRQAQNAADAGALAGAIARISNDTSNPPASTTSGIVYDNVVGTVNRNLIWGAAPPANTVTLDWTCPQGTTNCVVVDVFRDGTNNSTPLTTFFLGLVNINTQGVRAHAVAELLGANATGCMRPWFLIDRYTDTNGDGDYDSGEPYTSPGYRVPDDIGTQVTLHENTSPSGYGQIDVGSGTSAIRDAIRHCANGTYVIGQVVDTKPGNSGGQKHGIDDVLSWDPDATFNPSTGQVEDTCAPSCTCDGDPQCPYGGRISPRVIIVPVCDPTDPTTGADCSAGGPNNGKITIGYFLSFWLDSYDDHGKIEIYATLMGTAGEMSKGGPAAPVNGSFLKVPVLVR
jgi:Flp pilus assembly protein TadG